MKLFTVIILSLVTFLSDLNTEPVSITATVINISSNKGKINFALYKKEGFLTQPVKALSGSIENGKSTVVFKDVDPGEYAVVCYHDSNNNDKMDFSGGMPQESYGASNNVMTFGPPNYDRAKFVIADKDVSLEIKF